MLSTGQISIQRLVQMVSLILIFWLVIYPVDSPVQLWNNWGQASVVQKVDSTIQRVSLYPVDSSIGFPNTYPLDSDLSNGLPHPALEELGPGLCVVYFNVAWDKSRYFPDTTIGEMKSEVRLQKFHTVDVHYSDLGNACYLCQEGDLSQSIRSTTQIWEVISTVRNFCSRPSDVIWWGPVVTWQNVGSFLMLTWHSFNPFSPNSDQHQFSPNNIHTLSRR